MLMCDRHWLCYWGSLSINQNQIHTVWSSRYCLYCQSYDLLELIVQPMKKSINKWINLSSLHLQRFLIAFNSNILKHSPLTFQVLLDLFESEIIYNFVLTNHNVFKIFIINLLNKKSTVNKVKKLDKLMN